jgi:hypothetical protein
MTTSESGFPKFLTSIDDLTRGDHSRLCSGDSCLYLGEYTARKGYAFSPTNNLIFNFKKPMDRRGKAEWRYKGEAINKAAAAFVGALPEDWLKAATLVPIPPSKAKSDPLYDDRVLQMLRAISGNRSLDIRELIVQNGNRQPAHNTDERPTPDELAAVYSIDEAAAQPEPRTIALFDDVLVTGSSFVACKRLLANRFPNASIYGFFIARRVPESVDISTWFEDLDQ